MTQTVILPLSDEEKKSSESVESSIDLPDTKNTFDCTSVIQNNGLKFCDVSIKDGLYFRLPIFQYSSQVGFMHPKNVYRA